MDWINDLITELKTPFVIPNGFSEPIVIKNAKVQFRWKTIFITGEMSFPAFESIIDEELFNFDIDFVRPLQGGSMMLVGKPVTVKIALESSLVYQIFDTKMEQQDFEAALNEQIKQSESPLLEEYNWMVLTMSQQQVKKTVGHETIWNLINYDDENFLEKWEESVGLASMNFIQQEGGMDDFLGSIKDENVPPDELTNIFEQAKEQMMDKDNPMSSLFSKMFEGEDGNIEEMLSESMGNVLEMFNGMDTGNGDIDEMSDEEYESVNEVVVEHLTMLEIPYTTDTEGVIFLKHENDTTGKLYDSKIMVNESYIHVVTKYNQVIETADFGKIYRLLNGINGCINLGKVLLSESTGTIVFRTELSAPITYVADEPITDTMDENWVFSNDIFVVLDQYLEGKLTYENAIEEIEDSVL